MAILAILLALLPVCGRGTDGGFVVHLSAAKYKQRAGPGQCKLLRTTLHWNLESERVHPPVIIRSAFALPSSSSSTNRSILAWVREDLRYEWKHS